MRPVGREILSGCILVTRLSLAPSLSVLCSPSPSLLHTSLSHYSGAEEAAPLLFVGLSLSLCFFFSLSVSLPSALHGDIDSH